VPKAIRPMEDSESQFYVRMTVEDTYGVLAQITQIFYEMQISLASVIQKRSDPENNTAEIVLMTHPAPEKSMRKSVERMEGLKAVREIGNVIRVEG
jgi:homoserine dehydrogenase